MRVFAFVSVKPTRRSFGFGVRWAWFERKETTNKKVMVERLFCIWQCAHFILDECLLLFQSNLLNVIFDLEYDGLGLNEKKQLTKKLWSSVCFAFGNAPTSF